MFQATQSPTEDAFVQNPYAFYAAMRGHGEVIDWPALGMPCALSHRLVSSILRDRRMGRAALPDRAPPALPHLRAFDGLEAHSLLMIEPPAHTRLRGLVLRAFTSRRIAALAPEIEAICHDLIDRFPAGPVDLLAHYATRLPVIVICRLLGVPERHADDLLAWSNAMVVLYTPRRDRAAEDRAEWASAAFGALLRDIIAEKRRHRADDLLSELIAAEEDGDRLNEAELISTCVLLLNAGHEATVHTMGNGIATLLRSGHRDIDAVCVEELIRHDPPLHFFDRHIYEDMEIGGHPFRRGDRIGCLLGAANRDPEVYTDPARFDPARRGAANTSFGAGIHFCVGAPLARLELLHGLRILFQRCPRLRLEAAPRFANLFHFHGYERLMVST